MTFEPPQKKSAYTSRQPDANGYIAYTDEEHHIWYDLIVRQKQIIKNRACHEFLAGLDILNMSEQEIPQPAVISQRLQKTTGWSVATVAALISFDKFFKLLANRQFPAASFIRTREDFDYLQEPDIFHEYFGHCPLLTNAVYANCMQKYGAMALAAGEEYYPMFARLYWFTVEFGLLQTTDGLRCYGGGILSSKQETIYALDSKVPVRKPFNILDILRTPYRIDILQTVYFIIESFTELYATIDCDMVTLIEKARSLGMLPPTYPKE